MSHEGIDMFLVSCPENRRYLSGFTGSSGWLVMSAREAILLTDFRYVDQAKDEAPDFAVERTSDVGEWLAMAAVNLGAVTIGFESQNISFATHSVISKALLTTRALLTPTSHIVERLRTIKDSQELQLLETAVGIADDSLSDVVPKIHSGMTECQVAWMLEVAMRERGADASAFDIIVASGPNGALPHHRASASVIEEGGSVVIDMGAVCNGYHSDLTRTIFVGNNPLPFEDIHGTVLAAQHLVESEARSGMTGGEIDGLARSAITEAGYGERFGHGLGHGVGLAVHEYPRVTIGSDDILQDGMVFTVEPGIYLPGVGGVRIEDMVVMEKGVPRILSKAPKSSSWWCDSQ